MSKETEKMIVELKKEDRDLLKSAIKKIEEHPGFKSELAEKTIQSIMNKSDVQKPKVESHKNPVDALFCKDCTPNFKESIQKIREEYTKQHPNYECRDCGVGMPDASVGENNPETCIFCGGDHAKDKRQ